MKLEPDDFDSLSAAVNALENPGIVVQITNLVGQPVEYALKILPEGMQQRIQQATTSTLQSMLRVATSSMSDDRHMRPSNRMHKALATLSGAVGGAFGFTALAIELPVSTALIMRSVADIARSQGENIHSVETQLACLEVFAMGSRNQADDAAEGGYFATRAALTRSISEAAKFIAERGLVEESAPVVIQLISKIAARFNLPVTAKFAAQSIPAVGAAGGAAINLIFINHFQEMARGHFIIRRLERKYGANMIRPEYERVKSEF
jgi:hypothetical protein